MKTGVDRDEASRLFDDWIPVVTIQVLCVKACWQSLNIEPRDAKSAVIRTRWRLLGLRGMPVTLGGDPNSDRRPDLGGSPESTMVSACLVM